MSQGNESDVAHARHHDSVLGLERQDHPVPPEVLGTRTGEVLPRQLHQCLRPVGGGDRPPVKTQLLRQFVVEVGLQLTGEQSVRDGHPGDGEHRDPDDEPQGQSQPQESGEPRPRRRYPPPRTVSISEASAPTSSLERR